MTVARALPNVQELIAGLVDGIEIVATRRLGDAEAAREAAQETIARLLDRIASGAIESEEEIVPVAWGIARHVIVDMHRDRQRVTALAEDHPAATPDPLEQLVTADETARVRDALARLSPADRTLLHRCFVNGERIGAIAVTLGEPAERLRQRKSRALHRLATLLRDTPLTDQRHASLEPPMDCS
jgi:RNA polymerase sigma factor (sigma-70 family)